MVTSLHESFGAGAFTCLCPCGGQNQRVTVSVAFELSRQGSPEISPVRCASLRPYQRRCHVLDRRHLAMLICRKSRGRRAEHQLRSQSPIEAIGSRAPLTHSPSTPTR